MSLFRIILFFVIGFFLWRVIRATMRIMSSRRTAQEEDPFAAGGTRKPQQPAPYRDVKEADFEDITQKKDKDKDKEQSSPSGQQ